MSHQAAADVASTDITSEHNSNHHHQSPSPIHQQPNGSSIRDRFATTQNPMSDGNSVPGSSTLPPPARLARDTLDLEFSFAHSAMSSLTSEVMNTVVEPSVQSEFSGEAGELDMSASTRELHEGPSPSSSSPDNTVDTQGSLRAAGEERTVTLPGQKCLRGTPNQEALLALLKEHVNITNPMDPEFQTMELTDKLLPFYESAARPPDHNPYIPTPSDLQELILPILENHKMTVGNKRITILRDVDDWYGSKGYKGYAALRTASKPENDSALGDMSQFFQTQSHSSNRDSGVFSHEKRPSEQLLSTELPAKRLRLDLSADPTEKQAACQIPIASAESSQDFSLSSQNRSQDDLQPQSSSGLGQRVFCLEEGCGASVKGRQDMKGMLTHYAESHFATKVFLCPEPGCYEGFQRKERFFGEKGHFYKQHHYPFNDKELWKELQGKIVPTEINDIFHEFCPCCEGYVKHETYQEYADHRDEHLNGLTKHPFKHRCSEKTHHWRTSHCIPEEYRRKLDGKKKLSKYCIDPSLPSHKDQGNNGGGPPGSFGPGSNGPYGHQGSPWGGNQGGDNADTNYGSNTHVGSYHYQCSSQPSLEQSSFLRLSGNTDSRLQVPSREFSRTSIPGINLIKKCFESVRKLGRGGFGTVDEVRCKSTKKLYARKIIPLSQSKTKFPSEVEILKQLRHQHIINLDAYCITSDQLWLFMTPVAEKDLATYLRGDVCSFGWSEREHMRKWESCLASALKYLHASGLVHGDIKPQNILISSDMRIYLADFGSSRARFLEAGAGIEAMPAFALTPKYSAPEIFSYKSVCYSWQMGAAADVFSLGCVWTEIETVYTGLSIKVFENFRSGGGAHNSFQANLPIAHAWLDFLWVLQESASHASRRWTYGPSSLQIAKAMLNFNPQQRPSADQLTAHHCTCSIDTTVFLHDEHSQDRQSSATVDNVRNSDAYFDTGDLSPLSQINSKLEIKPPNCWEVTTEGFAPSGHIDAFFNWNTGKSSNWYSWWLAGLATSVTPNFFGGTIKDHVTDTYLLKPRIFARYQLLVSDFVTEKDLLQTVSQQLGAVIERSSSSDSRPMNAEDLEKFKYHHFQQHWTIPTVPEFHRSYLSQPAPELLSLEDYFRTTMPPSSPKDTLKLWVSATKMLFSDCDLRTSISRHRDIKPGNILIYKPETKSPYEWQYTLEDLRSSHSRSTMTRSSEEDEDKRHRSLDTPGRMGYEAPETIGPDDALELLRMRRSSYADIWSLGCLLFEFYSWFNRGWAQQEIIHSGRASWSTSCPDYTNSDIKPDAWLGEKARNSKQKLLESLVGQPDSLTKSIAASVIAPMLELPDMQPSLNWLRQKSRRLLNGARDSLNGYKKTVKKAATPFFSLVKSRKKDMCISSTLATDGRSDNAELLDPPPDNEPDGSDVMEDDYHKDADIGPKCSGYSYCLERYLRDKSDSRYLFPARGCNKMKELDKIKVRNAIERFDRLFISVG